jgi:hypothetical protein
MRNSLDAATLKKLLPLVREHEPSFVYLFEPQPKLPAVEKQYREFLRGEVIKRLKSLKLIEV